MHVCMRNKEMTYLLLKINMKSHTFVWEDVVS